MKKTKSILVAILAVLSIGVGALGFSACSELAGPQGEQGIQGEKGEKGEQGLPGQNGIDGLDGVSITGASVNAEGKLILTLSNGETIDCGVVKGEDGQNGQNGDDGEKGEQGEQGVGIEKVEYNEHGELVVTLTNGTSQTVTMPEKEENIEILRYQKIAGKEEYRVIGLGTVSDLDIVIPATYRGLPVTEIGANAFSSAPATDQIVNVTISDGVVTIGESAFFGCYNLTNVEMGDNVTTIGGQAFSGCYNLTNIEMGDNVITIGERAFYQCYNLTNVEIGDHVTTIGERAFYACYSLTSVTLGESVSVIGDYAFSSCYKLVEVYNKSSLSIIAEITNNGYVGYYAKAIYTKPYTSKLSIDENGYMLYTDGEDKILMGYTGTETDLILPNGVTEIIEYAFYKCTALRSVEIPDSVTHIGYSTFSGCTGLTSVVIGDGVTHIGSYAFSSCDSLISIKFADTSTWYRTTDYTYWENRSSGTQTGVTNVSTNATNFISTYNNYYWYKR